MRGASSHHRAQGSNVATRTAKVLEHAESVFDNEQDAVEWLSTPNPSLSGRAPLSLLDTDAGAREVDDVLTRLEFGVYG